MIQYLYVYVPIVSFVNVNSTGVNVNLASVKLTFIALKFNCFHWGSSDLLLKYPENMYLFRNKFLALLSLITPKLI